jgi:hypothetical protein
MRTSCRLLIRSSLSLTWPWNVSAVVPPVLKITWWLNLPGHSVYPSWDVYRLLKMRGVGIKIIYSNSTASRLGDRSLIYPTKCP